MSEGATEETPTVAAAVNEGSAVQTTEDATAVPDTATTTNDVTEPQATVENTVEGPTVEEVDEIVETKSNVEKKEAPATTSIVSEYDALVTWVTERLSVLGFDANTLQANNGESKTNIVDKSISSVIVDFITGEGQIFSITMHIFSL